MSSFKGFEKESGAGQEESSLSASPKKKVFGQGRSLSAIVSDDSRDSGFISPETFRNPKVSRRSPGGVSQMADSFKMSESPDGFNVAENDLPSKAIAELWNKPLKSSVFPQQSKPSASKTSPGRTNTPSRTNNYVPPTKLCFDSCESSADENETSPQHALASSAPSLPRKSLGFRRSISFVEQESSEKESQLPSEDDSAVNAKRQKLEIEVDDNAEGSPYKLYCQPGSSASTSTSNTPKPLSEIYGNLQSSLTPQVQRLTVGRSQSESALTPTTSIMKAVERIQMNPDLIGDGSKKYLLPSKHDEKHRGFREISGETLTQLIDGRMQDSISSFKIVDCRYPYEYQGGHIRGAINIFTRRQGFDFFFKQQSETPAEFSENRNIIIFHCEFSSQRAPEMCKFIRDIDRTLNSYPLLYHPETYVLFGGYKLFFEQFQAYCDPATYLRMDDANHVEDYKRYKLQTRLEYPLEHPIDSRSKKSRSISKFSRFTSFSSKKHRF